MPSAICFCDSNKPEAGATYTSAGENQVNTAAGDLSLTGYDIGPDAAWELDIWSKFGGGIESAGANLLASGADYDDLLVGLTATVATSYALIRTFEDRIDIAQRNVAVQQCRVDIAHVRFRSGPCWRLRRPG